MAVIKSQFLHALTIFIVTLLLFSATTEAKYFSQADSLLAAAAQSGSDSSAIEQLIAFAQDRAREDRPLADTLLQVALSRYRTNARQQAFLLSMRGQVAMVAGNYAKANDHIEESQKISDSRKGLEDIHLRNLNILGLLHYYQGAYDEGLSIFFERLSLSESSGDLGIQLRTLNNIGICYERLGADENAMLYYGKGLAIVNSNAYADLKLVDEDQRQYYIASINANIGNILYKSKDYKKALNNFNMSYEVAKKLGNKALLADEASNLGRTYMALEDHARSEQYNKEAVLLAEELAEPQRVIITSLNLAENLSRTDRHQAALVYLEKAEALALSRNISEQINQIYRELRLAHEDLGNFQQALSYATKLAVAKDSLYAEDQVRISEELSVKYQAAEKEIQIADQQLKMVKQRGERNAFLGGLVGVSFLSFFIWYRNRMKRKEVDQALLLQQRHIANLHQEQKILAMDLMMQGQEEERKRIAQDLHDGLGGLLSRVRSKVFNIQTQVADLEKMDLVSETEELVQKACDEVRRISHDMMPASLISLGLNDAIEDLLQDIQMSKDIDVDLKLSTLSEQLPDKYQVQIYRIIQEFVSNTLKHGGGVSKLQVHLILDTESVQLVLADNGRGFNLTAAQEADGIGLKNIFSRVKYLGGKIDVKTSDGQGCRFDVELPRDNQ